METSAEDVTEGVDHDVNDQEFLELFLTFGDAFVDIDRFNNVMDEIISISDTQGLTN